MTELEEGILANLKEGVYDGCACVNDGYHGGNPWGVRVIDGRPEKFRLGGERFFDGKENVYSSWETVVRRPRGDQNKLDFLAYYGYSPAFAAHPEIRECAKTSRQAKTEAAKEASAALAASAEGTGALAEAAQEFTAAAAEASSTAATKVKPEPHKASPSAMQGASVAKEAGSFLERHGKELGVGIAVAVVIIGGTLLVKYKLVPWFLRRKEERAR